MCTLHHVNPPPYVRFTVCKFPLCVYPLRVYVPPCICPYRVYVSLYVCLDRVYTLPCVRSIVSKTLYSVYCIWAYKNSNTSNNFIARLLLKLQIGPNKLADLVPRKTWNAFEIWLGFPQTNKSKETAMQRPSTLLWLIFTASQNRSGCSMAIIVISFLCILSREGSTA